MNFRALFALISVVTSAGSTLRSGLKGSPIKDHRRRLCVLAGKQPQHLAQIVHHGLKAARLNPTLGLLLDGIPRGQIVGNHPPGTTRPHHIAQSIKDRSHRIVPLWGILPHQRQIRSTKPPFLIADIAWVIGSSASCFMCHPKLNAWYSIQSTALFVKKFMTRSKEAVEKPTHVTLLSIFGRSQGAKRRP